MSPNDKTTAWTPIDTGDPAREHHLAQAYLLCQRQEFDEAKRILQMLLRTAPGDRDAQYLMARIVSTEQAEKQDDEKLRSWRFRLGLQSSWSRFMAYVGALAAGAYGSWNVSTACGEARTHGLSGLVTSWLTRSRGRYGPTYVVEWTRPVYYDLLYGLAFAAVAVAVVFVVFRVSRGAALWEEIGDYQGNPW